MEVISAEGFRQDGRTALCMRQFKCCIGLYEKPNGSSYVEMGNTKVLVSVYGPREVRSWSKQQLDECVIQCEMSRISSSQGERVRRPRDNKTRAMNQKIAGIFQAAIRCSKYPGSQIDIYIQVMQTDGGILSAAINAASLALIHAGVEMQDFVASCTASYASEQPILDVSYNELLSGCEVTVAIMPNKDKIVGLDMSDTIHHSNFEAVLDAAIAGCHSVYESMHLYICDYLQNKHAIMFHK